MALLFLKKQMLEIGGVILQKDLLHNQVWEQYQHLISHHIREKDVMDQIPIQTLVVEHTELLVHHKHMEDSMVGLTMQINGF